MNPGEIPMKNVFFGNFLDTVAATHDKNRVMTRLGRAAYV